MKFSTITTYTFLSVFISSLNLYAQYDSGTVIYSQTGSTNLTAVLNNYQVVDFDGDNYSDILMVKDVTATNTSQLTWYKGDGSGNFSAQANMLSIDDEYKENEIFYADMNGDGIGDIVFQNNDTGFKVLVSDGQGNISSQINNVTVTGNLVGADLKEMADVDGDGDMDGVFFAKTDSLNIFGQNVGHSLIGYNNGTGTFSNYSYLNNIDFSVISQVETGDIDGDGDVDIICNEIKFVQGGLIGIGSPQYHFPSVRLYKNTGLNNYAPKQEIGLDLINNYSRISYINIKVQNLSTDSNDELLIEYSFEDNCEDELHWFYCENFNQFQVMGYNAQNDELVTLELYNTWLHGYYNTQSILSFDQIYNDAFHIQFGNQNTDNNLDILSVNVPQGRLQWYLGDGNGGFNNTQVVNFNNQYSSIRPTLRVADIDNDTDLDVFVLLNDDTSSTLTVFKNLALSPICAPVLDLAATPLTNGVYQAGSSIVSSGSVVAGSDVTLKAGEHIKLQIGFRTPANATVSVNIGSCN